MPDPVLRVTDLSVWYPLRGGVLSRVRRYVKAVRSLSFSLGEGEILAVVGESGCGKSTLAQALVGLAPWHGGDYELFNEKIRTNSSGDWEKVRGKMQMIFQDPFSSLNPRQTVSEILSYPLLARRVPRKDVEARAKNVLARVGLPENSLQRFPHEFSGGQRQRIGIARALMLEPRILVCDEVTSALDVSVQAQVLQLLDGLRRTLGISLIFISHDIQVVRAFADKVLVMYLGELMEYGPAKDVLQNPRHPYTEALIASVPTLDRSAPPKILGGDLSPLPEGYAGCSFAPRCPSAFPHCREASPEIIFSGDACARCFLCKKDAAE